MELSDIPVMTAKGNIRQPFAARCVLCHKRVIFDIDPKGELGFNGDWATDEEVYTCRDGVAAHMPVEIFYMPNMFRSPEPKADVPKIAADRFTVAAPGELVETSCGVFYVVTNCICVHPHDDVESYIASHRDGCLMKPYEGFLLLHDGQHLTDWKLIKIIHKTEKVKNHSGLGFRLKAELDEKLTELALPKKRRRS